MSDHKALLGKRKWHEDMESDEEYQESQDVDMESVGTDGDDLMAELEDYIADCGTKAFSVLKSSTETTSCLVTVFNTLVQVLGLQSPLLISAKEQLIKKESELKSLLEKLSYICNSDAEAQDLPLKMKPTLGGPL